MGRHVLIVDDHADSLEALQELLRSWAHEVDVAATGAEGIALARDRRPDVVLLDIGLPDIDGYEVARRIRAVRDGLVLIALTGSEQGEKAEIFDAYLVKPPEPLVLRAAIEGAS